MHRPLTILARVLLVLFVIAMLPSLLFIPFDPDSSASGPGGHGCKEGNLIPNCGFDQFAPVPQGQAPAGWTPFVLSGDLAMDGSPDTYWGAPSLRMWSDGGTFVAGIYTQIGGLTPGATYSASMGWGGATEPDAFARKLGIDPTGGTDPNSPNIVWGSLHRGPGRVMNDSNAINIDAKAVARGSTVTVFVWVDHNYSTGANQIFIDAVGLYQDAAPVVAVATDTPQPVAAAPQPAATQPKAAATTQPKAPAPTKRPPTATPTNTQPPTPAPTATPPPTETPSPTPTATLTRTPEDTATPSVTPSSTLPSRPRATAAPVATQVASTTEPPRSLLFGGVAALLMAGVLSLGMVVRRRK